MLDEGVAELHRIVHSGERSSRSLSETQIFIAPPCYCYGGVVYIGSEEDGEDYYEPVRCRGCERKGRGL
jgi:hypothetical protein